MRGLTVRQPCAQAIACGLKRIETRGQRTRYRGRLGIHAALGHALPLAVADLDSVLAECRAADVDTDAVRASLGDPDSWSFGKIIAVAELFDCVPVEDLILDPVERAFGGYSPGQGSRAPTCASPSTRGTVRGINAGHARRANRF